MSESSSAGDTSTPRFLDGAQPNRDTEQADPYVLQGSANATVEKISLKHGDAFLVADARGDLPESEQETGLYWRGTRFLRTCDVFLSGQPFVPLSHSISDEEGICQIDLTNPFLRSGNEVIYQGSIHARRLLVLQSNRLVERVILTSYHSEPLSVKLGLKLGADFRDIFEVRGMSRQERGVLDPPQASQETVTFGYAGHDHVTRVTQVHFTPAASQSVMQGMFWDLVLPPGTPVEITIAVDLQISGGLTDIEQPGDWPDGISRQDRARVAWSDNVFFNRLLTRGVHDLVMMCTPTAEGLYPYGGIPWYVAPFGRDALITSIEFLPWFPEIACGTLGFLAAHQGVKVDTFTEEEPGRILHEYRLGEMANCREIPFIPYYGTIDATPLFLITLEQYIRWTNDIPFLKRHWSNAEAAAGWMRDYGDADGDGFLEYAKFSDRGLANQGWKDSWDSVMHADGNLAPPPIALCEVQGYAYAAYRAMAYLANRLDKREAAAGWERHAEALRVNFLRQFWWEEEQFFYLALDGEKRPCKVVSSNAGQCLWTGIVPDELANAIISRLMSRDMYTEWGIRTLSSQAVRYNPMSYHNGSVWPHDTALIGAGFSRYKRKQETGILLGNLFGVSLYYAGSRLPELFCGFDRVAGYGPTRYPVACAPQSWAAGAPFLLLSATLGFQPEAEYGRLTLHAPSLPDWMRSLELDHLYLGSQDLHLRFERSERGTSVILDNTSEVEVHVIPG